MYIYEKCTTDQEEAKKIAKETKGKISTFLSIDEKENPITVYCIKYKQLF